MPLHDHFHPPWSLRRPWEGFHSAWATTIAYHLNSAVLPAEYYAMPLVQAAGRVEVDVATLKEPDGIAPAGNGIATAVWAPPQPTQTEALEAVEGDTFEVQVLRDFGGPQLRAAIEIVSPANKDRGSTRRAFAAKCAGYLRHGVSVVVIDVVTERSANLHAEIMQALEKTAAPIWAAPTQIYALAYRSVLTEEPTRLEMWLEALAVGMPLPELPMWLEPDLCVPLQLEESYASTCTSLRMGG